MRNDEKIPLSTHSETTDRTVAMLLSDEARRRLAGFFDVLIQMDLAARKQHERNGENNNDNKRSKHPANQTL